MKHDVIQELLKIKAIVTDGLKNHQDFVADIVSSEMKRTYLFERLNQKDFLREDFLTLAKQGGFNTDNISIQYTEIVYLDENKISYKQWEANQYLLRAGDYLLKKEDDEVCEIILEVLEGYQKLIKANLNNRRNFINDLWISELILKLPLDKINSAHINFIRNYGFELLHLTVAAVIVERFAERVVANKDIRLLHEIVKLVFGYTQVNQPSFESDEGFLTVKPLVEGYNIKRFVEKFSLDCFKIIGKQLFKTVAHFIEEISKHDKYKFHTIHIISLEKDEENWDFDTYESLLIKFLKDGVIGSPGEDIIDVISDYKSRTVPIFIRLVFFAINEHYSNAQIQKMFWSFSNPLNIFDAEQEIYSLLENHKSEFSLNELEIIYNWVEAIEKNKYEGEAEQDFIRRIASNKYRWLNSVKDSSLRGRVVEKINVEFETLKKQFSEINDRNPFQHVKISFETDEQEVLNLPILTFDEAIKALNSGAYPAGYNKLNINNSIRNAFSGRMDEVYPRLKEIEDCDPEILYALLGSLRVYIHDRKKEDWSTLFDFLRHLLLREDLWQFEESNYSNYNDRIWHEIGDLFREFSKKENKELIESKELIEATQILLEIEVRYQKPFKILNQDQKYFDVLNSVRGSIYEALIGIAVSLALRDGKKVFYEPIKEAVTKRLQSDIPYELLWVIGTNLAKIGYLDIEWIGKNKSTLFNTSGEMTCFKGYILYVPTVYKDLYSILYDIYCTALLSFTDKADYTSKLIQHVSIIYEAEWDKSNTLMNLVFNQKCAIQIEELINYYANRRNIVPKNQIQGLWKRVLEYTHGLPHEKKKKTLRSLIRWVTNIHQLDESYEELLDATALDLSSFPYDYYSIAHLEKVSEKFPKDAGVILLKGLKKATYFDLIHFQSISKIVGKLYEGNENSVADEIVMNVTGKGLFFLVDLYEKKHFSKL